MGVMPLCVTMLYTYTCTSRSGLSCDYHFKINPWVYFFSLEHSILILTEWFNIYLCVLCVCVCVCISITFSYIVNINRKYVFKNYHDALYLLIEVIFFYALKFYLNILSTFFLSHFTLVIFQSVDLNTYSLSSWRQQFKNYNIKAYGIPEATW